MKVAYIIFLALWIALVSVSTFYLGIAYPLWVRAVIAGAIGGVSAYLFSLSIERQRKRREGVESPSGTAPALEPADQPGDVQNDKDKH